MEFKCNMFKIKRYQINFKYYGQNISNGFIKRMFLNITDKISAMDL